jgi:hypothetical protein
MYGVLYDSMLAMYQRQKIRPQYIDFYAVTSLAAMEFLNSLSIVAFLAYFNVGSVRELFHNSGASKRISVVTGLALLAINYTYGTFRARSREAKASWGARQHWVASAYMVLSVAVMLYTSRLVDTFQR